MSIYNQYFGETDAEQSFVLFLFFVCSFFPFFLIIGLMSVFSDHDCIYRGSYMSAHVLLNLLNQLGKREKM